MSALPELTVALRERGFGVTHAVRITHHGPNKIAAIKAVRDLTSWGLKRAVEAMESAGTTIVEGVGIESAQHAAATLRETGATVEIRVAELYLYAFDPTHPRRGEQALERLRVSEHGLALEHGQLGAWTPEDLLALHGEHLLAAIDEHRDRWARAGKREATDELSILEQVSAREPALEDRLRTSDGEARAREALVYGDWLLNRGDPRGLIPSAHPSHLFGPCRELMDTAEHTWLGPVLDTLCLHHQSPHPPTCEQLAELLATPVCACLRALELDVQMESDGGLGDVLAAAACAPGLRELRIEHASNLALRGDAFARLETLAIAGRITLGPARLPALRTLDVNVTVPFAPPVASFVKLETPALEHLIISALAYEYWEQNYGPLQNNLIELLSQPSFARLRTLKITRGSLLAGFAGQLARIPAIVTLECIDLRGTTMTDECRTELARSRDRLPKLLI